MKPNYEEIWNMVPFSIYFENGADSFVFEQGMYEAVGKDDGKYHGLTRSSHYKRGTATVSWFRGGECKEDCVGIRIEND